MFLLLGILFGVAIALGPLSLLDGLTSDLSATLIVTGQTTVDWLTSLIGFSDESSALIAAIFSVAVPGLIAAALVAIARGSKGLQSLGAGIMIAAAVAVIAVNRDLVSVVVAVGLLAFGLVVTMAVTKAISFAAGAMVAVIAAGQVKLIADGDSNDAMNQARAVIVEQLPDLAPQLITAALCLLAVAPVVAVASAVAGRSK